MHAICLAGGGYVFNGVPMLSTPFRWAACCALRLQITNYRLSVGPIRSEWGALEEVLSVLVRS
jgi:hypothetical protein